MIAGFSEEEFFESGHNACAGCGPAIAIRHILKSAGKNTIVVSNTGCIEVVSTLYPRTAWKVPWIHGAFENGAAIASGIDSALSALGKREGVNIIVIAGDGGTFDIGLQALSGMAERGHKVLYVCYDNEAYMNCLSLDSLIFTEKGLKKITEIKKGENIYAFNQNNGNLVLKKCTGVFDNGKKEVYELSTLHHNIKATANHPFLVLKRNGRGKENTLIWKTLSELKRGDNVIVLKNLKKGRSFEFEKITLSKKGDYKVSKLNYSQIPKKSNPEIMELLGIYVGDGWTRAEKSEVGFALPENKKARKRLLELNDLTFKCSNIRKNKMYVYLNSVNIAKFIDSLGFLKGAKNKIIPEWVFTLPDIEKEAFVKGLMLSDRYKIGESCRYVSASFELLKRLRLFLNTMNYRTGKIHRQKKEKGTLCAGKELKKDSEYGYVCFSRRNDIIKNKYESQHKYQNFLFGNKSFEMERISNIKLLGVIPTLDLRVEGEHNFIADGIVVHNTGIQRSGATPKYTATTTSPAGTLIHGKERWKKQISFIMAAHGSPYVAVASIAYLKDLDNKVKKALSYNAPTFIHVLAPCPVGWEYDSSLTVQISKLAVTTNFFPIYEIENGGIKINLKLEERTPLSDYIKLQKRFKHLTPEEIEYMQKKTDESFEFLKSLESKGKLFQQVVLW